MSPVTSAPYAVHTPSGSDTVCSSHADSGCGNSSDANVVTPFQSYLTLPAGFFATAGRSVRITYQLLASTSTSPPSPAFSLSWQSGTAPLVTLFSSDIAAQPSHLVTGKQFSITCIVTAGGPPASSTLLYSTCTSSAMAYTTLGGNTSTAVARRRIEPAACSDGGYVGFQRTDRPAGHLLVRLVGKFRHDRRCYTGDNSVRSSFLMLLGLLCFGAPLMALGPFTTLHRCRSMRRPVGLHWNWQYRGREFGLLWVQCGRGRLGRSKP